MAAPLALFVVGAGFSLAGSIYGANMAKKDMFRQARSLEDQARLIEEQAQFDAIQTGKQFEGLLGEQKLNIATSGAEFEGSVLNILDKTIQDKEENIKMIKRNAQAQASFLRSQAAATRKKGKGLLKTALISSAGNIGQSGASFYSVGQKNLAS